MDSAYGNRPGRAEAPQDDQLLQAAGPKGRQPCTDGARPVVFKIGTVEEEE